MSYEPLASGGTGVSIRTALERTSPVDDKSYGFLSGYVDLSAREAVRPTEGSSEPRGRPSAQRPDRTVSTPGRPARRDAIRRALLSAKETAGNLETYARAGELVDLSLAGFKLRESLGDLWKLRFEREEDWGDLLNILQGALAQEEFERLSAEQCCAIRTIVADHLGAGGVGVDDIEESIRLLRKAGFDPWKGISSFPDFDEE